MHQIHASRCQKRDARIAMVMQQTVDEEPDVCAHNTMHHDVGVSNMGRYIGSTHHASHQPFSPKEKKACSGEARESWAGGVSLHHDHHRTEEMASSSSLFEPEATPAGNSGRYPSGVLNSIGEMRKAQISLARAMEMTSSSHR